MANTVIQLKYSTTTGTTPASLANGELAINSYDGKLFYRNPAGTIQTIQGYTGPAGLNGEVQFNDSGILGSSANLSFNKTTGNLSSQSLYTGSFIQFSDGSKQYTANAGTAGLGGYSAAIDRQTYTATLGQTSFNVNYVSPYVLVIINGVTVDPSEYTATTNTNITLVTATKANDIVDLIGFSGNTILNAVDQTARNIANTANVTAQAAFDKANTDTTNISISTGTFGNASIIPVVKVESNGRISSISNATVSIDTSQIASGTLASARLSGQYTGITDVGTLANGTWTANSITIAYTDAKVVNVGGQTGAISNNQLLSFLLPVDGIGSGLDADLLDGLNSTSFANATFAQAAFDTANGKFANTGGYINGFVNVSSNISVGSYIDLNTAPSNPTRVEGRLFYDKDQHAISYYNEQDMTLQIGQENVLRVWNNSGTQINNGKAVYITPGASANGFPNVALANAATQSTSEVIGLATQNIPNGGYGYITRVGKVNDLNTSLFTEGQELYLSATSPGDYTNTPPAAPAIPLTIGYTTVSHVTTGAIYVSVHLMEGINKTTGAILFARNNAIDQDPTQLYWDYANNRLGISTNVPQTNLHVAGDGLFSGNLTISGNLIISNAQSIVTQTLDIGGNNILLNANTTGVPTTNAQITIVRGSSANAILQWDESIDEWTIDEGTGTPGHIISSEKTFTSWTSYGSAVAYAQSKYPVGATISNTTNELAKTANTVAYNAQNLAIAANTKAYQAYDQANTDVTSVSATAGVYGSASIVPVFRAEANGRISTIANSSISIDTSQIASGTLASARLSGQYTGITDVGTLANGTWTANSITIAYTDAKVVNVGGQTGAISNNQLLSFLLPVDGIGSGLDADLLDGLQGSSYANATFAQASYNQANTASIRTINFIIDGGGSVITTGSKGNVFCDFTGTISGWTILGDASGTITVDISKATYTNFPTFTASGGTSPALSTAQKNQSFSINWTGFTTISANDVLQFAVSGTPATVKLVTVALKVIS